MYKTFYDLKGVPFFDSTNPDYFYPSEQHRKALAVLKQGLENGPSASLFCGEPGIGKTITCRQLMKQEQNAFSFGFLTKKGISPDNLLQSILFAYGLNGRDKEEPDQKQLLHDFIINECYEKNRPPTLIVDDAEQIDVSVLKELITLPFTEKLAPGKGLKVILVGQSSLLKTLKESALEQYAEHIEITVQLLPLNPPETQNYMQHRLAIAGTQLSPLFAENICAAVHRHSGGNPALINKLCGAALVFGFTSEKSTIDAEIIDRVVTDQKKGNQNQLDPNSALAPDLRDHFSLMLSAQQSMEQGATEKAEQFLLRAVQLRPNAKNIRLALEQLVQQSKKPITVSEFIVSDISGSHKTSDIAKQTISVSGDEPPPTNNKAHGVLFTKDWPPLAVVPAVVVIGLLLSVFVHFSDLDSESDENVSKLSEASHSITKLRSIPVSVTSSVKQSMQLENIVSSKNIASQEASGKQDEMESPSDSNIASALPTEIGVAQEQTLGEQTIEEKLALNTTISSTQIEPSANPIFESSDAASNAEDLIGSEEIARSDSVDDIIEPREAALLPPGSDSNPEPSTGLSATADPNQSEPKTGSEKNKLAYAAPLTEETNLTETGSVSKQRSALNAKENEEVNSQSADDSVGNIEYTTHAIVPNVEYPTVAISARVSGPIVMTKVFLSTNKRFEPYTMYDDRTHGDTVSNDGEFRTEFSLKTGQSRRLRYYIAAYTKNGEVLYDPANRGRAPYYVNLPQY